MFSLAIISTVLAYVMVFNFIFHWIFKERNPIEMIFINILGFVVYGIFAYTSLLAGAVAYFSGYPHTIYFEINNIIFHCLYSDVNGYDVNRLCYVFLLEITS